MHAFEQLWREGDRAAFAIECGSGTYVRSLIADLGDAYCLELRRTRIGPFDVADAGRFVPLDDALRLPAGGRAGAARTPGARATAWRYGRGQARCVARRPRGGVPAAGGQRNGPDPAVRLVDDDGLIALAEPRGDGTLKPVVGFRG